MNLADRKNLPISYFYIVHYWPYSKFAELSSAVLLQRMIRQTLATPNFFRLWYSTSVITFPHPHCLKECLSVCVCVHAHTCVYYTYMQHTNSSFRCVHHTRNTLSIPLLLAPCQLDRMLSVPLISENRLPTLDSKYLMIRRNE